MTDEELALVARANQLSNALVILETEAMNAVEGKFKDASGNYTVQGAPTAKKRLCWCSARPIRTPPRKS